MSPPDLRELLPKKGRDERQESTWELDLKALVQSTVLLEAEGKGVEQQKMEIRYLPLTTEEPGATKLDQ